MSAYVDAVERRERAAALAEQASDPINCPKRGGNLDTGYECLDCGFDATPKPSPTPKGAE